MRHRAFGRPFSLSIDLEGLWTATQVAAVNRTFGSDLAEQHIRLTVVDATAMSDPCAQFLILPTCTICDRNVHVCDCQRVAQGHAMARGMGFTAACDDRPPLEEMMRRIRERSDSIGLTWHEAPRSGATPARTPPARSFEITEHAWHPKAPRRFAMWVPVPGWLARIVGYSRELGDLRRAVRQVEGES